MHRLTELKHHVIGDIDQRMDASHTAAAQTFAHPQRCARHGINASYHTPDIDRTGFWRGKFDVQGLLGVRRHSRDVDGFELAAEQGGQVPRDTTDTEAIGTIGREIDLHHRIVELHECRQGEANWRVARQFENAAGVLAHTEFIGRTQHAGRLNAANGAAGHSAAVTNFSTRSRVGGLQSHSRIGRATYDLVGFTTVEYGANI